MDAAEALADLMEISTQIEAAVLAERGGAVLASTLPDRAQGERFGRAALELLAEAERTREELGRGQLVQLEAALPEGSVIVVADERNLGAAVTRPHPAVGLVFYDLKTCLRGLTEDEAAEEKLKRARLRPPDKQAADAGG